MSAQEKNAPSMTNGRDSSTTSDKLLLFQLTILENVRDSVIVTDLQHRIIYWNQGATLLFGYSAAEMMGKTPTLLDPEEDEAKGAENFQQILEGQEYTGEWRGKRKDGTTVWIDAKSAVLRDPDETIIGFISVARDITERKAIDETLRESEERFRLMADTAPVLIWMADTTTLCTYFNKVWLDFTGRTMAQEYGNGWAEGVHPDDLQPCLATYLTSFEKREAFSMEYRLKRFDGVYRWILYNGRPRFTPNNTFIGYIGSCIDITAQKEAEEQLRRSEERYRLVVENVSDIITLVDKQGNMLYISPSCKRVLGHSPEELVGMSVFTFVHPEDLVLSRMEMEKALVGDMAHTTCRYQHKDGHWVILEATGIAIFDEQGRFDLLVFTSHDTTERTELEKRKDDFISMASHELKTPVTSIKAYTQVLYNRFKKREDEETVRFLTRMNTQLTKLSTLISDLLDLTKMQTGKLTFREEHFMLDTLVKDTVENMQEITSTHHLLLESEADIPVYGDKDRIEQVVINLLTNAIKYSPQADNVVIRVEKQEDGAVVSVQDFGIGIAEVHQEKIFERFYQVTDPMEKTFPGLGIGLYISNAIIQRYNGRIWVKSKKEEGSTFSFLLPLHES